MNSRLFRATAILILIAAARLMAAQDGGARTAEHVVLVVWDGMRPDFVAPQFCPTLYGLATNGVFFAIPVL